MKTCKEQLVIWGIKCEFIVGITQGRINGEQTSLGSIQLRAKVKSELFDVWGFVCRREDFDRMMIAHPTEPRLRGYVCKIKASTLKAVIDSHPISQDVLKSDLKDKRKVAIMSQILYGKCPNSLSEFSFDLAVGEKF